jgi:hypothetical protein
MGCGLCQYFKSDRYYFGSELEDTAFLAALVVLHSPYFGVIRHLRAPMGNQTGEESRFNVTRLSGMHFQIITLPSK